MSEIFYDKSELIGKLNIGIEVLCREKYVGEIIGIVKNLDTSKICFIVNHKYDKKYCKRIEYVSQKEFAITLKKIFENSYIYLSPDLNPEGATYLAIHNVDIIEYKKDKISELNPEAKSPITSQEPIGKLTSVAPESENKLSKHYGKGTQPLDLMKACGAFEGFCVGSILKYAFRMNKKNQKKQDIMKIIDYALMLANENEVTIDEVLEMVERRY